MSYTTNKERLELSSGKIVKFEYAILESTEVGGVVVVCLDIPTSRELNENVYGISGEGTILWQVKPVKHVYENSPYVGVMSTGELARLFNWDGMVYDVDPRTGEIRNSYWGK